jgi:hypothetical protein
MQCKGCDNKMSHEKNNFDILASLSVCFASGIKSLAHGPYSDLTVGSCWLSAITDCICQWPITIQPWVTPNRKFYSQQFFCSCVFIMHSNGDDIVVCLMCHCLEWKRLLVKLFSHVSTVNFTPNKKTKKQRNSVALVREQTISPNDCHLSEKFGPTSADSVCCVVSNMDPYNHILGFLDQSRYFFSSSFSVVLMRLSEPRSGPTTSQKMW